MRIGLLEKHRSAPSAAKTAPAGPAASAVACPRTLPRPFLRGAARIALFCCLIGCQPAPQPPPSPAPAQTTNFLLISLDTTRADHLGCYGGKVATPTIDALARDGVLFERCYATAPLTLPSHATIFTATYPFVHGVRDNGSFRLGQSNQTLAEALSAAGYATAACVGAVVLNAAYGLDQGFQTYRDLATVIKERPPGAQGGALNELRAADVTAAALQQLREQLRPPFFLFVHYFDAHDPYEPPPPYDAAASPYEGEIAYIDAQLQPLIEALRDLGHEQSTLVLLTADHGEALGQHGEDTHGHFLYDSTLRVPWVMRWPGKIPAGLRVAHSVASVDIAPTALELLGVAPLPLAQGISLKTALLPSSALPARLLYSETFAPQFALGFSPLRAVRHADWKLIHAPRPELYRYEVDSDEQNDRAAEEAARVAALRAALRELIEAAPALGPGASIADAAAPRDAAATAQLQALGYVGAAAGAEFDELESLDLRAPNPMDHPRVIQRLNEAIPFVLKGDYPALERKLRELLQAAGPVADRIAWAQLQLASALFAQGRHAEAAVSARKAVDANPRNGEAHTLLGMTLSALGQNAAAIASYRRAIASEPEPAPAHRNLGLALLGEHSYRDAATHLARAIEIDAAIARDPSAHAQLAQALLRAGDRSAARRAFEQAAALARTAGDDSAAKRFDSLAATLKP